MTTNHSTAKQTGSNPSSWIQQLWQRFTASIGDSSANKQTDKQSTSPKSAPKRAKGDTPRPEPSSPPALIGTQTLKAFSDYADGYEPTDLALAELIPADLALLNIPPAQLKASSDKEIAANKTDVPLIKTANTMATYEEIDEEFDSDNFDSDSDDEYLMALVPSELSELSEDIEKTLPDLAAF